MTKLTSSKMDGLAIAVQLVPMHRTSSGGANIRGTAIETCVAAPPVLRGAAMKTKTKTLIYWTKRIAFWTAVLLAIAAWGYFYDGFMGN